VGGRRSWSSLSSLYKAADCVEGRGGEGLKGREENGWEEVGREEKGRDFFLKGLLLTFYSIYNLSCMLMN
jgi:hypothetical protein